MITNIKQKMAALKDLMQAAKSKEESYTPIYRVASIDQDQSGEYSVTIQMIGKAVAYTIKPEELLADDKMVDLFSPRDIRNLTYLGYLGMNAPKYKILAQQLSENCDQTIFAIHKKGDKKHSVVTAKEISANEEILKNLSQKEAHMIGFAAATEQMMTEKQQKETLLKQLHADNDKTDSLDSSLDK